MRNDPVIGYGFVLYDEYDGVTGISRNVPEFLDKIRNTNGCPPDTPDFEVVNRRDVEFFDAFGFDAENIGVFEDLRGNSVEVIRMFCVRHEKEPAFFDAPYKTRQEYVDAVKTQLREIGFLNLLPEDFDYEGHIGRFRYVKTSC